MADADEEEKFRADVKGHFNVSDVIPHFLLEGYAALAQIEGSSEMQKAIGAIDKAAYSSAVLPTMT